jgi:hypothetical protein
LEQAPDENIFRLEQVLGMKNYVMRLELVLKITLFTKVGAGPKDKN